MTKRQFSKQRLEKLVFWLAHIIGGLSVALGINLTLNYSKNEAYCLNQCDKFPAICNFEAINNLQKMELGYWLFGIGLVAGYWIVRFTYNYLFPKK